MAESTGKEESSTSSTAYNDSDSISESSLPVPITPPVQQYFEFTARFNSPEDTIGIKFCPKMTVQEVCINSPFYNKIQIHDILAAIAGCPIISDYHYKELVSQYCNQDIDMLIYRRPISEIASVNDQIEVDGEDNRQKKRSTDRFLLITLNYVLGLSFGAQFRRTNKGIFVDQVFPNSIAFRRLQTGDLILDVDGYEMKTIFDLKNFIYAGFQTRGSSQILVQRSETKATKTVPTTDENDFTNEYHLPDETCSLGSKLAKKYIENCEQEIPSILIDDDETLPDEMLPDETPDVTFINEDQFIDVEIEVNLDKAMVPALMSDAEKVQLKKQIQEQVQLQMQMTEISRELVFEEGVHPPPTHILSHLNPYIDNTMIIHKSPKRTEKSQDQQHSCF